MKNALKSFAEIEKDLAGKRPFLFLDYDGVLTPIVARPELAVLSDEMRAILAALAIRARVAVVSGRDLRDVRDLVGLDELVYAGSHGLDIAAPGGVALQPEQGGSLTAAVARATQSLEFALAKIPGALIEPKRFAVAVHYRLVADDQVAAVEAIVDRVLEAIPTLTKSHGKKVFELRPRLGWDKGKAVLWLLSALKEDGAETLPFYLGDDLTDEDAFRALRDRGVTIFVGSPARTAARYQLADPKEVAHFLKTLMQVLDRREARA
ncbi:MAG: trehalose-phosphatase [Propylenella sp.]